MQACSCLADDVRPGAVAVAAGGAAHGAWATVDIDGVGVVAAVELGTLIGAPGGDIAIAAVVGVAPAAWTVGLAFLQSRVFGLFGEAAILLVHRAANLAADDAADHGASHGREHVTGALADLIADDAACDRAGEKPGILVRRIAAAAGEESREKDQGNAACQVHSDYLPADGVPGRPFVLFDPSVAD
ncbi:protein of unknown function [Hyphomicrobium sp. 1Nfss2.1]